MFTKLYAAYGLPPPTSEDWQIVDSPSKSTLTTTSSSTTTAVSQNVQKPKEIKKSPEKIPEKIPEKVEEFAPTVDPLTKMSVKNIKNIPSTNKPETTKSSVKVVERTPVTQQKEQGASKPKNPAKPIGKLSDLLDSEYQTPDNLFGDPLSGKNKDVDEVEKELMLCNHSEKLAIGLGLVHNLSSKEFVIKKNLRMCGDCHTFTKLTSKMEEKQITIRDVSRFHHFKNGNCSCGDYF